ncbi:MAG TPA: site-2 protease family protein [Dongiaceae bacterium]|nr:site-2 protease family protein [Dongiaceae bacterium]
MGGHDISATIQAATTWVLPILFAIPLHEAAHGFVAFLCGDRTAYMLGRVTANPLKHIDPMGTILLPAIMWLAGGFLFGYAKPVPVNYRNLRHPRRDSVLVAAAGPGANFIIATISALLFHLAIFLPGAYQDFAVLTLWNSMQLNVWLALFNLIPIPPLDGGRVAVGILPRSLAMPLARLERHGMLILMGLIFLGIAVPQLSILGWILRPASSYVLTGIAHLTGIASYLGF